MIGVEEAQKKVLAIAQRSEAIPHVATADLLGMVIAEDIVSDVDLPPFRKSMMDGYAVRSADCVNQDALLFVVEEITAGKVPTRPVEARQASRIMTGAPLPEGADAVVMVEQTECNNDQVTIHATARFGQNIQPIGWEMKNDEVIVSAGTVLRPAHLGLLATLGRMSVRVFPKPTIAIVTTGDEIVAPDQKPKPGQIRNSNAAMLQAQCELAKAKPRYLGIARDERDHLRKMISDGLTSNILMLSGGVSAGKLDLVPEVLQDLGVTPQFHKIAMKPGKPLFFGSKDKTLVFGLPGNPVSSFVGFELFVRSAINRFRGVTPEIVPAVHLPLESEFRHSSDRPTYHPAIIRMADVGEKVSPTAWHGSPDLKGLSAANALCLFPPGEQTYSKNTPVPVYRLPS
jgi:molybdopterin molybdotransferase